MNGATINFVSCQFDVANSDICTMEQAQAVVFAHYSQVLADAPRDPHGNVTVEGRYIVITGVDGMYKITELTQS